MEKKELKQATETKELNVSEMEKAAGGCILYCTLALQRTAYFENDEYEFWKCRDCGREKYEKNGKEIQPSEYYYAEKRYLNR